MREKLKRPKETKSVDEMFDVALSFAGEDRAYVEMTANVLKQMGIRVFYDKYEQVSLWGKNLYEHLSEVYGRTSRYTVMFISKHYAKKLWTNHERQSAQAKAFSECSDCILPARFDDTAIPGLHATIGYVDLKNVSPPKLAELIKQKIGPLLRNNFMPADPDRLLKRLGTKTAASRRLLTDIATGIFQDISLMRCDERRLVSTLALNTCPCGPEIDGDVHIHLGVLSRLSGLDRRAIVATCARIECLGFSYKLTCHDKPAKVKNILRLTYEPMRVDPELSGNWTKVMHGIFSCMEDHLCPECYPDALDRMDWSVLSTLAGFPEVSR